MEIHVRGTDFWRLKGNLFGGPTFGTSEFWRSWLKPVGLFIGPSVNCQQPLCGSRLPGSKVSGWIGSILTLWGSNDRFWMVLRKLAYWQLCELCAPKVQACKFKEDDIKKWEAAVRWCPPCCYLAARQISYSREMQWDGFTFHSFIVQFDIRLVSCRNVRNDWHVQKLHQFRNSRKLTRPGPAKRAQVETRVFGGLLQVEKKTKGAFLRPINWAEINRSTLSNMFIMSETLKN